MSTASAYLTVRGIDVDVVYKDIKNLHIGVYPPVGPGPGGRARAARRRPGPPRGHPAPAVDQAAAEAAAGRRPPVDAGDGHRRVPLRLGGRHGSRSSSDRAAPTSRSTATDCCSTCRKDRPGSTRRSCSQHWHREQLRRAVPPLISQVGAEDRPQRVRRGASKRMKTKWGSCNRETGHIWFNLELAKKHPACLEYIVVHEMTHLLERNHGERFTKLMDSVPDWRTRRDSSTTRPWLMRSGAERSSRRRNGCTRLRVPWPPDRARSELPPPRSRVV